MGGGRQTERGRVEEAEKAWLRRERLPTPVFWPGEFQFHGLYSPWGRKELDTTEQLLHTRCCQAVHGRGALSLLYLLLGALRDHDACPMAEISQGARGTQSPLPPGLGLCHHHHPPTPGRNPPAGASPLTPSLNSPRTW